MLLEVEIRLILKTQMLNKHTKLFFSIYFKVNLNRTTSTMETVVGKKIIQQEPETLHIMIEGTGRGLVNEMLITTSFILKRNVAMIIGRDIGNM